MKTLDQALKDLLEKNMISREAAAEKAKMPADFK
jgi:Tfp pilus assembly pilus retraction ATPase PilT